MKMFLSIFIIVILISCSENKDRIEALTKENQVMREQIEKYKREINEYEFKPTVIPKSDKIGIGNDFESLIGMTISKKTSTLNIKFGEFINGEFHASSDTLSEPFDNYILYRKKSLRLGEHKFAGKIEFSFFDTTFVNYFESDYTVVEN